MCLYLDKCKNKFLTSKFSSDNVKIRSDTITINKTLELVYNYIETSGEFKFQLEDIQKVCGDKVMSNKILFDRLKNHYQEKIHIDQGVGKKPIIYYNISADKDVFQRWFIGDKNINLLEKKIILQTAAEILQSDFNPSKTDTDRYPPAAFFLDDMNLDIPQSLRDFLNFLIFTGKTNNIKNIKKIEMTCHSLLSLQCPKFNSKLLLSIGIYILRKTGKRQIVDLLYKLGVCASYEAVQLFETSTVLDPPEKKIIDNFFVQYIFDNTDHNVYTLDGRQTFHCLGEIAAYTPGQALTFEGGSKKLNKMPKAADISFKDQIPIKSFTLLSNVMDKFMFRSTKNMSFDKPPLLSTSFGAYLWCKAFQVPSVPSFKGFMEFLSSEVLYNTSSILCQPFINLPPSDLTTLNTALCFAAEETKKNKQHTTIVTFDQPLYYKARCIIDETTDPLLKNTYVCLGGFHFLMSYFGSIGFTMDGSGLEDLWSEIYAPNSIKQMMSGHAFSRALRAHILTFTAIGIHICRMINTSLEDEEHFFEIFEDLWNKNKSDDSTVPLDVNRYLLENSRATINSCKADTTVQRLTSLLMQKLNSLEENGPTAKLWLQYFKLITFALQFLEAERLGNYKLHLQSIREMLPLFHSTGHFAYAKCGQMYLQDAEELEMKMTDHEYHLYAEQGYFTIRRTDKPWSGVWSDMTIETTLNRFFGTDLRHGRGVTPSVVARYLGAMPSAFTIMESLEEYCGITTKSSEQHVDLNKSRYIRDFVDINRLLSWLDIHKPFELSSNLKSLSTGLIADKSINCHQAIERGLLSMDKMIGKKVSELTLSRTLNVKPSLAMKNSVHLNDAHIFMVDTNLIFQRLLATFDSKDENLKKNAFSYELSPFPLSIFDNEGFMRKTTKSDLYKILKPASYPPLLSEFQYVIDGGWLLRKVIWPHSETYNTIFNLYLLYVINNFNDDCVIVFDGYSPQEVGTKSYERL